MMERLKAIAHAMSGFSGFVLSYSVFAAFLMSYELRPEWQAWKPWVLPAIGCFTLLCFAAFPRMREEVEEPRFALWGLLLLGCMWLPIFTISTAWPDIHWFVDCVSFGRLSVPAALEPWCLGNRALGWSGVAFGIANVVWAWRKFTGLDRVVLGSISMAVAGAIASIVFPDAMRAIGLVVAGFFISLTWGGNIGDSARNVLRTILALFGYRPKAKGPTSIEVPEKGAEISKL